MKIFIFIIYSIVFIFSFETIIAQTQSRTLGNKSYEVSNHLGNVMAVVSDRKTASPEASNTIIAFNETDIKSFNDYYPYGMLLEGRNQNPKYRFGFNGHESYDELIGRNSSYDFGARIYNSKIARYNSIDPWDNKYQWQSPFVYHKNSPISLIDWNGLGDPPYKKIKTNTQVTVRSNTSASFKIPDKNYDLGNETIVTTTHKITVKTDVYSNGEDTFEDELYRLDEFEVATTVVDHNNKIISHNMDRYGFRESGVGDTFKQTRIDYSSTSKNEDYFFNASLGHQARVQDHMYYKTKNNRRSIIQDIAKENQDYLDGFHRRQSIVGSFGAFTALGPKTIKPSMVWKRRLGQISTAATLAVLITGAIEATGVLGEGDPEKVEVNYESSRSYNPDHIVPMAPTFKFDK